jgi:hypothetical protein
MLMLPAMQSLLVCVTVVRKLHVFCKRTNSYVHVSSAQSRLFLCLVPYMHLLMHTVC